MVSAGVGQQEGCSDEECPVVKGRSGTRSNLHWKRPQRLRGAVKNRDAQHVTNRQLSDFSKKPPEIREFEDCEERRGCGTLACAALKLKVPGSLLQA